MAEMQRIVSTSDWLASTRAKWSECSEKIIQQAKLEANHKKVLQDKLSEVEENGNLVQVSNTWL